MQRAIDAGGHSMEHHMGYHVFALLFAISSAVTLHSQTRGDHATAKSWTSAGATLFDGMQRMVGEARLHDTVAGVLLRLDLTNVTPGIHALHVHERGMCEAPSFTSANGHFAPRARDHGFLKAAGPHAGDLPNIHVPTSLKLSIEYVIPTVTLHPGPASLLDRDGAALVIHAGPDNYMTEPEGEAVARIACGVIVHGVAP